MTLRDVSPRTRLIAAVAVLLLAPLSGWILMSSHTAGEVSVAWSYNSPSCTGAKVMPSERVASEPVIRARRGMHCTIKVVVTNRSGLAVHLEALAAPYIVPHGGGIVQAEPQPPASGNSWRSDVTYPLDVDLAAGESTDLEIGLGFQESGCNSATTSVRGWPSLSFRGLGLTHERVAENTLTWVQDGPSVECPHRRDWSGR